MSASLVLPDECAHTQNQFGEMDVDGDLVASASNVAEDVMMLNNGCVCCTVRGDLVKMVGELVSDPDEEESEGGGAEAKKKKKRFDHILIETTGLADPRPIVQTFFNEATLVDKVHLDGVVCVVDSYFAEKHLDEKGGSHKGDETAVNEAKEQICYSDRIVINKVDLVEDDAAKLEGLEKRIRDLNPMAEQKRTCNADVDVEWALGVGGFNLETVASQLESQLKLEDTHKENDHDHAHDHDHDHDHEHDHHHHHHHHHHHDDSVGSVSLVLPGDLDLEKVNLWLETLLMMRSNDIYRTKGVLALEDWDHRFVFQAVHEMFSGAAEREWGSDEERVSRLVFIGKDLNQEDMMSSFKECLAQPQNSKEES